MPLRALLLLPLLLAQAGARDQPLTPDQLAALAGSPNALTEARLPEHNLRIVSHFSPATVADLAEELPILIEWIASLLGDPEDLARPETLLLFDPGALEQVVKSLQARYPGLPDARRISGVYLHDDRLLLSQDLGRSLRHELVHALHYQSIDRAIAADPSHPINHPAWITDGLSTLAEAVAWEVEFDPETGASRLVGVRPVPDQRVMVARNMHRTPSRLDLRRFCTLSREDFYKRRVSANYATARALFLYMHDRGVLPRFYQTYLATIAGGSEDALWGITALEAALGEPLDEIEADLVAWLRTLSEPPERLTDLSLDLGLWLRDGEPDGVRVFQCEGPDRRRTGLQYNDVITHVNGRPVRNTGEYLRVMTALQPELEAQAAADDPEQPPTIHVRYRRGGDAVREAGRTRAALVPPREYLPL